MTANEVIKHYLDGRINYNCEMIGNGKVIKGKLKRKQLLNMALLLNGTTAQQTGNKTLEVKNDKGETVLKIFA